MAINVTQKPLFSGVTFDFLDKKLDNRAIKSVGVNLLASLMNGAKTQYISQIISLLTTLLTDCLLSDAKSSRKQKVNFSDIHVKFYFCRLANFYVCSVTPT